MTSYKPHRLVRVVFDATESEIEVLVVDVTETPIERPKKTAAILLRQEETAYAPVASRGEPVNRSNYLHGFCEGASP